MRVLLLPVAGLLGACASTAPADPPLTDWTDLYPEIVDPARETDGPRAFLRIKQASVEQLKQLDRATALYIAEDEEQFAAMRDELAQDPVTAYWLTRWLLVCVIRAREAVPPDGVMPLGEPVWARPIQHIEALGDAAVPAIVLDLLRHPRSDRVALGGELLAVLGADSLPRWEGVFELSDARARRRGTEALGTFPDRIPAVDALLERMSRDGDFGVRAAAYVGLARDPERASELTEVLASDPDPYVRRELALALGAHESRVVANALIDYMQRSIEAGDDRGMLAADEALRKMSGKTERATPQTWRSWASTIRD